MLFVAGSRRGCERNARHARAGTAGRAGATSREFDMLGHLRYGVLAISALALVGCGSGAAASTKSASSTQNQTVTVKGTDLMRFDPPTLTVKAGSPVRVTLDDAGAALVHDFVIDDLGGAKVSIKAQPNGKASGEFTPPAAGTYQFYCAEPGHKEAGMVGTLIVTS